MAKKFQEEEINGGILLGNRLLNETVMEKLGLKTIGKQEHFKTLVNSLKTKGKMTSVFKFDLVPDKEMSVQ